MQNVVPLPLSENADPNRVSLEDAIERIEEEPTDKLSRLANTQGNFADALTAEKLIELGATCCDEYERDKEDRKDWQKIAEEALESASQDKDCATKDYPWKGASNINVPLLTTAALEFNARMYPAVVKGDEAVLCKVVGKDAGRPQMAPNPQTGQMQPVPQVTQGPDGNPQPATGPDGQLVPLWEVEPGAKASRAQRVSEYMNTVFFYRMEDWEDDTDALLMQLPIVGCVFRKVWYDPKKGPCAAMVPALRLLVPDCTRSLETTPRITEELPDVFPYTIRQKQRSGWYLDIDLELDADTESDGARLLLEQHRLIDLDDDGLEEPYIVTLDHETRQVLRIEANFGPEDIEYGPDGAVECIKPISYYIKYGMFPHPKGKFYDIGLGHLLKRMGAVIDTALNQLMDAGTAQTAGGGFIGSGVRLQSRGNRGVVRMAPGEYKTVEVSGDTLRANIVERTLPNVSPVTFQVLDFIMGFARQIAGSKDVLTGEASNSAPVGSTLALIEQGLQVFNAVAKRYFRAAKKEYSLLYENLRRYGGEKAAQDYQTVLDDTEADFKADFAEADMDIRPVSDPATVTRMQKMARSQYIQQTIPLLASVGGDAREALRRTYEAADIEDIDKLLPPPQPQPPDPLKEAQAQLIVAKTAGEMAGADKKSTEAAVKVIEGQIKAYELQKQATADGAATAALG